MVSAENLAEKESNQVVQISIPRFVQNIPDISEKQAPVLAKKS